MNRLTAISPATLCCLILVTGLAACGGQSSSAPTATATVTETVRDAPPTDPTTSTSPLPPTTPATDGATLSVSPSLPTEGNCPNLSLASVDIVDGDDWDCHVAGHR